MPSKRVPVSSKSEAEWFALAHEGLSHNLETGELWWKKPNNFRAAGGVDYRGYPMVGLHRAVLPAHRLIFLMVTGRWPATFDHINCAKADNRWCNLREATHSQNMSNKRTNASNKSGAKGVSVDSRSGRARADICVNGKRKNLGYFDTVEEAKSTYDAKARELHGEFFRTGFCVF